MGSRKFTCECLGKNQPSHEELESIAEFLKQQTEVRPKIAIICGTGLGSMADVITDRTSLEYGDIPKFPVSTVEGHAGKLHFGFVGAVPVVCMQGRFHLYEGHPAWKCILPIRIFKSLGATHLIASNAAGGLHPDFKIGDVMVIQDHVNFPGFAGINPLTGPNEPKFGPRFVALNNAYNSEIIKKCKEIMAQNGLKDITREGVYGCVAGPSFETAAECRMLRNLGVDAVGMSTTHEVIAARHLGLKCFAFSLITNIAIVDSKSGDEGPNNEEVLEIGKKRETELQIIIKELIAALGV